MIDLVRKKSQKLSKILYIKGGNAIEEGRRLAPLRGSVVKGGPDQFFLAIMSLTRHEDKLRLVSFGAANGSCKVENIELIEYGLRRSSGNKLYKILCFSSALIRFILSGLRFSPKTIICGLDGPVGLASLVCAKFVGARFIFSVHSALDLPATSKHYKLSNKLIVKYADHIVAHGEFLSDQIKSYGVNISKLSEFAASIDSEDLNLINEIKAENKGPDRLLFKKILYIGRVEEDKGVFDLLNAFHSLDNETAELVYLGQGSALNELIKQSETLGIKNVKFLGHVEHSDVYRHICSSSFLVAPSQSRFPEGRPKTIIEALTAGVPVIAPSYGPFPYLIRDQVDGLLYEPDNVNALAYSISRLLNDDFLLQSLSIGAIESAKTLLDKPSYYNAMKRVLESS